MSLCNFYSARRPNLLRLISLDRENVNKKYSKSLQGSNGALISPPTSNSNTTGPVEGSRLGVFDRFPQSLAINWKWTGGQVVVVSCCPHYFVWQRDCLVTAVLKGQGRVAPIKRCVLMELCTLRERWFNVWFLSFLGIVGKKRTE